MNIQRVWAMPNHNTFQIKPINELIDRYVNSGDWIDRQAAKATGESISFINKEKTKIDLSKNPTTLVERAIATQYRLMIEHTVSSIKKGFSDITKTVRTDDAVDVVVAGGTSSPNGFTELFKEALQQVDLPIKIGNIIKKIFK